MIEQNIYERLLRFRQTGRKGFAVLIDPDKEDGRGLGKIMSVAEKAGIDFFLVGGSHLQNDHLEACVELLKTSSIPVVLFPGDARQISAQADAILLLSLISGRNSELLIGQHVAAAPLLKTSGLEILPTGYMLVDGGAPTSVSYISGTQPIPATSNEIAANTALAGQMLGMKLIYLEAGSGARNAVPAEMIKAVRAELTIPLIVGGGISNAEMATAACEAGADLIVVGNAIEKDVTLIEELAMAVHLTNVKARA